MKQYHVYILTSKRNGTLYVGSSSELVQRIGQHKSGLVEGFTKKYKVHMLVYFEEVNDAYTMVTREQNIKKMEKSLESCFNRKE